MSRRFYKIYGWFGGESSVIRWYFTDRYQPIQKCVIKYVVGNSSDLNNCLQLQNVEVIKKKARKYEQLYIFFI